MRDGVILYADIYRPALPGRYPVIVGRTPYSTDRYSTHRFQYPDAYKEPLYFAQRGYVYLYQDIRGRYESEGSWEPFFNDIEDGYDTIEWAAKQPWSTGRVGMQGVSYLGTVQWRTAIAAPPHLVTIAPIVASTSPYHDWVTSNGAWRLSFNLNWGAIRMGTRVTQNIGPYIDEDGPENLNFNNLIQHLPLNSIQELTGTQARFFQDWIAHPDYDEYWKSIDAEEVFSEIGIPVLNIGGWFDIFVQGTLRGFTGMQSRGKTKLARQGSQLVIGPWGHWPSRKVGELDFGDTALIDLDALTLKWFDYWLKGIENGVADEGKARIFVMGANEWRSESSFPPKDVQFRKLHLQDQGELCWDVPAFSNSPDMYQYDPLKPTGSMKPGVSQPTPEPGKATDTLIYTSAKLTKDLEVIGPLQALLYASSDVPDTDFVITLMDVGPDEQAYPLAEGILRARYRESTSTPVLLQPGTVYPLKVDLIGIANVFKKGHSVRVKITSSAFPAFDRNLNTAAQFGTSSKVTIATQSIYHNIQYPSHILLPVISGNYADLPCLARAN